MFLTQARERAAPNSRGQVVEEEEVFHCKGTKEEIINFTFIIFGGRVSLQQKGQVLVQVDGATSPSTGMGLFMSDSSIAENVYRGRLKSSGQVA